MTTGRSISTLAITWLKPDMAEEQWEFFHHPRKQEYYQRHAIGWEQLLAAHDRGQLVPYPRGSQIMGVPVSLAHASYDDYARYLAKAKRGYRLNYSKMEEALQRAGTLSIAAPILLMADGEALLFAGYRRLCLAWNYGMVPYVWLVRLTAPPNNDEDMP